MMGDTKDGRAQMAKQAKQALDQKRAEQIVAMLPHEIGAALLASSELVGHQVEIQQNKTWGNWIVRMTCQGMRGSYEATVDLWRGPKGSPAARGPVRGVVIVVPVAGSYRSGTHTFILKTEPNSLEDLAAAVAAKLIGKAKWRMTREASMAQQDRRAAETHAALLASLKGIDGLNTRHVTSGSIYLAVGRNTIWLDTQKTPGSISMSLDSLDHGLVVALAEAAAKYAKAVQS